MSRSSAIVRSVERARRRRAARRRRRTRSAPAPPARVLAGRERRVFDPATARAARCTSDLPIAPDVESAEDVVRARLAVAALGQIEVADAEVVRERVIALQLGAEHLRLCQHVLEARRTVERVVRLADRIGEVAGRQRRDDRLRVERVGAVGRERQRRVLLPERPVQAEAVALVLLVAFDRRERVARVERRRRGSRRWWRRASCRGRAWS